MVVFTLPLVLTSFISGFFADRLSKRTVIITMKAVETLLMAGATLALFSHPTGGYWALAVLACMGVHSAIFSPAKYGILPELLPHEQLARGNSLLELFTFLAILTGTTAGGFLLPGAGSQAWLAPLVLTLLALAGFVAAWTVPPVPAARAAGGLFDTLFGFACDASVGCSAFTTNKAQFAIDNISVVPEPAQWLLMGLGLAALGAVVRRRHAAA